MFIIKIISEEANPVISNTSLHKFILSRIAYASDLLASFMFSQVQLITTPLLFKFLKQTNLIGFLVSELYINTSNNVGILDILMQPEEEL